MGTQALAFWKGPADPGVKRLHSTLLPNIHKKRKLTTVVSAWITFMVVFLHVHTMMLTYGQSIIFRRSLFPLWAPSIKLFSLQNHEPSHYATPLPQPLFT